MISLVIAGHGNFGSGMNSSLELISGKFENVYYYDFEEGKTTEDVDNFYDSVVEKCSKAILFLTDLSGGTPFNRAVNLSLANENVRVVSGTNLGMIITAALSREIYDETNIDEFVGYLIEEGQKSIEKFKLKENVFVEEEDGI